MQIVKILLRVIFLLSTIVTLADCCSSRILLLKKQSLRMVQQQKQDLSQGHGHGHDHDHVYQQLQHNIPQHIDIAAQDIVFNRNYTGEEPSLASAEDTSGSGDGSAEDEDDEVEGSLESTLFLLTTTPLLVPESPATEPPLSAASTPSADTEETTTTSELTAATDAPPEVATMGAAGTEGPLHGDATVRELQATNPKYHVIDFYYTIMRDVLLFECSGQYLTDFCLNGGRCFRYPVGNHSFFSCECTDGFVGERCESKSLNGLYAPTTGSSESIKHRRILTARIVFSFPMLIAISGIYLFVGATIVFRRPHGKG